jgi:hypothetical protein
MRISYFLLALSVVFLAGACRSTTPNDLPPEAWVGHTVAYSKAVSEKHGIVGFVKTKRYTREKGGEPFDLYHVLDLELTERGIVDQRGAGTKYEFLPPEIARVKGKAWEEIPLQAQPLALNVAVILGLDIDEELKLLPATAKDLE